jgi:hypothetical protein
VEWYPTSSLGQLRGYHVSPRLRLPPLGLGQLRGHHVSPWLRCPPPGAGELWGYHMAPRLWHPPPSAGQLQGRHVSPWLRCPPHRAAPGVARVPAALALTSGLGWVLRHHVSLWHQRPPPGSGQLRGWLQRPPPGAGQLRGCHVSPWLRCRLEGQW